jgi:hypothetical protein
MARARELLVVSAVAFAITVAVTWPMTARFGSSGRLENGDARFSIWNVSWVAHALTSNPGNLWNANIFYPHTGTLAYSEANLVAGAIGVPAWLATHSPYATSNFTILVAFILAAVTMYGLVRYLTSSRPAAMFAAVSYAFSSYMFAHMGHIQLLMISGPALALLCMHRFVDRPRVATAAWLGLSLCAQALACGYYGLYGGLIVALGIVWFGVSSGQWRQPRFAMLTVLAAVLAIGLTAPFLAPYVDLQHAGFARTMADARLNSATWLDYLTSPLLLYRWMLPTLLAWGGWHEVLFPGALVVVFAAVAVVFALRSSSPPAAASRSVIGFYVVLAALAAWGSFGPDAKLYTWMVHTVPFMTLLRAPARLGVFVMLALTVLAGAGFATLERGLMATRRTIWLAAIAAVVLMGTTVGPLTLEVAPPESRASVALRQLPAGPIAEFPFFVRGSNFHEQTRYMVASAFHWRPLVNGYSDFLPPDVEAAMPALAQFPSAEALHFLRARGVRYVLVHWDLYTLAERAPMRSKLAERQDALRPMLDDPTVSMYELSAAGR